MFDIKHNPQTPSLSQTVTHSQSPLPFERDQWRSHARAITGCARVKIISARAVASPENVNFKDSNSIY